VDRDAMYSVKWIPTVRSNELPPFPAQPEDECSIFLRNDDTQKSNYTVPEYRMPQYENIQLAMGLDNGVSVRKLLSAHKTDHYISKLKQLAFIKSQIIYLYFH
jgi:hypothetical protein